MTGSSREPTRERKGSELLALTAVLSAELSTGLGFDGLGFRVGQNSAIRP